MDDLASLRAEYELGGLDESDLTPEPLALFGTWFAAARAAGIGEPNAMVLATVGAGAPSSRRSARSRSGSVMGRP